jgi:hypothetical protein
MQLQVGSHMAQPCCPPHVPPGPVAAHLEDLLQLRSARVLLQALPGQAGSALVALQLQRCASSPEV